MAEINDLAGPPDSFSGQLSWKLKASGGIDWPLVSGEITAPDLKIMNLDGINLKASLQPETDSSTRIEARAGLRGGSIGIEARVPPALKGVFSGRSILRSSRLKIFFLYCQIYLSP